MGQSFDLGYFSKLIAVTCLSLLSAWCKLQNLRHLSTVNCSPNKPAHDKTRKWRAPNKDSDQISLRILTVWSEFSLCAHWVAKDPIRLHADSEHSDQTLWVHRLIWVFAGRTDHLVFVVLYHNNYDIIRATSRGNLSSGVCDQVPAQLQRPSRDLRFWI